MKDEQKGIKNEGLVVNLQNFHSFSSFGQKIYGQKLLNI